MVNIRKLESDLWESADLLRSGSKLTSNQYCMPVLGLIFLRYAYSRFKLVEEEILKNRPSRGGRVMPVEANDFVAKSALFLPREAQYSYLLSLPENIAKAGIKNKDGHTMNSLGEAVNNAMSLIEEQSEQLTGVLPKTYTDFSDEILSERSAFSITARSTKSAAMLSGVSTNTSSINLPRTSPRTTVCFSRPNLW